VRLRDGEREVEVSGSAGFVRQVLEDLPLLLARLRGETRRTRPDIGLPPPPPEEARAPQHPAPAVAATHPSQVTAERAAGGNGHPADSAPDHTTANQREPRHRESVGSGNGHGALDDEVIAVVRTAGRPIGIAEIRRRLRDEVSGQQVRRILERHPDAVTSTGGRPAAYRPR